MSNFLLNENEIYQLTGYKRSDKQIEALCLMDVKFHLPPDGKPRVVRSEIEAANDGPGPKFDE